MILDILHRLFPHHIPIMSNWVYAVAANKELECNSLMAKYLDLAIEYIERED